MPEQNKNSAVETKDWRCPACGCANVEYPPYPVLEVLCDSCGQWADVDLMLAQSTAEVA